MADKPTMGQVAKSKGIRLGGVVAVLGLIQSNSEQLQQLLPEAAYGWIMLGIGAAIAYVRAITDKPLNEK